MALNNFKIELNNPQNIRDLLQCVYKLADEQIKQAQNEINKLSVATRLQEEPMESKAKYAKAINDYLGIKDKAIGKKIDVAKIMTEIYKNNGDIASAIGDGNAMKDMTFDFEDIKKMVDDSLQKKTKKIELTKK